jgi:hypothetical protein
MTRVSRRYVLLAIQNVWNMGTLPHLIYHKVKGKPWDHGNIRWMSLAGMRGMVKGVKVIEVGKSKLFTKQLRLVEKGMFDIPIWPDTWDMGVPGLSTKNSAPSTKNSWSHSSLSGILAKKGNRSMGLASLVERGPMPKKIKLLWAHHVYALYEK